MSSTDPDPSGKRQHSPLIPIGFLVIGMLTIPILLYSTSPEGPIKEGDVVFATGHYRAYFLDPDRYSSKGYDGFCYLDQGDQLMALLPPTGKATETVVAKILGENDEGIPFCPSQSVVRIRPHQISLKVDIWPELRAALDRLFSHN